MTGINPLTSCTFQGFSCQNNRIAHGFVRT